MVEPMTDGGGASGSALQARVDELDWYHTFELPGGVVTPGYYDLRSAAAKLPMPDVRGLRCLDVASADGFWAFEMKRRGASEVVSVDLSDTTRQDWQGADARGEHRSMSAGRAMAAFELVREATGLWVERRDASVYDIDAADLGTFDVVFMGNILLHLSDPARALRAVHAVTDGIFVSLEEISLLMTALRPRTPSGQLWHLDEPRWWTPNVAGHRRLVQAAGFEVERSGAPLFQRFGDHLPAWPSGRPNRAEHSWTSQAVYWLFTRRLGCPSSWVHARPIR
jgi:tRNA (mo5U34)-methyltransferase